jgi:putative beta-lysine N-acetyltransferase
MKDYIEETIMRDTVEANKNGSILQHGKHNDRIYLMKLNDKDVPDIFGALNKLAYNHSYAKIICKIPKKVLPLFIGNGFLQEAYIPGFIKGKRDICFVSKFMNSDRLIEIEKPELEKFSGMLHKDIKNVSIENLENTKYKVRHLMNADAENIAKLYQHVFTTYPFPIHQSAYILKTMQEDVCYYGIEKSNKLIAVASSEMDKEYLNAEMTDFATHPDYAGNNLSSIILNKMEEDMKRQGIKTLYTIARLASVPMNKTFLRFGYHYTGTLIKNTNISGNIESMNILYKQI